jgi:hypothetical protein
MVSTATKVDWTVVHNEVEALQLEYSWIKEFDPRFNIKYRDDKSYPWLAVTVSEEIPRVMVGRGAKRKGTRYFGRTLTPGPSARLSTCCFGSFRCVPVGPECSKTTSSSDGPACSAISASAQRPASAE